MKLSKLASDRLAGGQAGASVVVSKRLRRRPSKWVIAELMIFDRATPWKTDRPGAEDARL